MHKTLLNHKCAVNSYKQNLQLNNSRRIDILLSYSQESIFCPGAFGCLYLAKCFLELNCIPNTKRRFMYDINKVKPTILLKNNKCSIVQRRCTGNRNAISLIQVCCFR